MVNIDSVQNKKYSINLNTDYSSLITTHLGCQPAFKEQSCTIESFETKFRLGAKTDNRSDGKSQEISTLPPHPHVHHSSSSSNTFYCHAKRRADDLATVALRTAPSSDDAPRASAGLRGRDAGSHCVRHMEHLIAAWESKCRNSSRQ